MRENLPGNWEVYAGEGRIPHQDEVLAAKHDVQEVLVNIEVRRREFVAFVPEVKHRALHADKPGSFHCDTSSTHDDTVLIAEYYSAVSRSFLCVARLARCCLHYQQIHWVGGFTSR